jgi:hypothetical protein
VVLDAADEGSVAALADTQADTAVLVFALSAVAPPAMAAVLRLAHAATRVGGLLLFRDYGLYDMPMLRFAPEQRLAPHLFRREDGTLAYFFSIEEVQLRLREQQESQHGSNIAAGVRARRVSEGGCVDTMCLR